MLYELCPQCNLENVIGTLELVPRFLSILAVNRFCCIKFVQIPVLKSLNRVHTTSYSLDLMRLFLTFYCKFVIKFVTHSTVVGASVPHVWMMRSVMMKVVEAEMRGWSTRRQDKSAPRRRHDSFATFAFALRFDEIRNAGSQTAVVRII